MKTHFRFLCIFAFLAGAVCMAAPALPDPAPAGPSTAAPSTRPATQPTGRSNADLRRIARLTRKSLQLLEQRKLDDAEKVLREAVALDPDNSTNLYNLACVRALKGDPGDAVDYLQRAADAGFTDFLHIDRDSDLKSLRDLPRFKQFLARKDAYQRKAAERAVADLKSRFGDSYLYEVDEADKLVFATNVDQATLEGLKHWLKAQAHSQWAQIFEHKPDEFVTIVVPSLSDYKKLIRMPGVEGIYIDEGKILIAEHLGQVMTHEFTHALHAADRAPLGQDHPIWLAEGLASMYEAATFEGKGRDELTPHDNFRLYFLQNAARGHALVPLDRLFKMKQSEFIARPNMAYGEASSLLLYLYERGLLKQFYDTYKAGFEKDGTGRDALEQVTGKKLADLEKSWTEWMVHRSLPARSTGPDGAFVGAELGDDTNDGIKLRGVLAGGPAEKAGLKVNDVLVGIDDTEVRDMQSFGPVMSTRKPGEQVVLKVRRDGKYLDVPLTLGKRSAVLAGTKTPRGAGPATQPAMPPPPATRPAAGGQRT